MTVSAVLFDVDGTLVDSNYLHVDSWQRALAELDEHVDAWRVHRAIGQDSKRLLTSLVGERDEDWISRAKDLHSGFYRELAPRLRAFDQAAALLRSLDGWGISVVLASSAPDDELQLLLNALDAGDAISATTSADDVEQAKPDPGIIHVALDRAGAGPSEAVMVGDSVWDHVAAGRAGVRSVGLLSGGTGRAELADAGAFATFADPADLLAHVDTLL
jgi:phosphoglycolate phosphatase-like HAD superfamily hydrolase